MGLINWIYSFFKKSSKDEGLKEYINKTYSKKIEPGKSIINTFTQGHEPECIKTINIHNGSETYTNPSGFSPSGHTPQQFYKHITNCKTCGSNDLINTRCQYCGTKN